MNEVTITIPGKPQARQAHRHFLNGKKIVKYLPKESASFQERVAAYAYQAMAGAEPISTPVAVEYLFIFEAPKSLRKAEREAIARGELLVHESRKNDVCNLLKCANDGLSKVAIADDGLIVDAGFSKRIGATPCTIITIRPIHD